jgi:hypothetical protein
MTPRQTDAFLKLANARRQEELADLMSIMALASRAEPKDIEKRYKELTRGF